jgi:hypothetical protein
MNFLKVPKGYEIVKLKRNKIGKYFDQVLPNRTRLLLRKIDDKEQVYPILTVLDATGNCFSIKKKQGFILGTVDTILQLLCAYYMTYSHFTQETSGIPGIIWNQLTKFEKFANKEVTDPLKRISADCYGTFKTPMNIKKEKWNKRGFMYRPSQKSA